jgi:hypothetical protein
VITVANKDQAASFAKAITQDEFGRFYWDARRESEVRRSLAKRNGTRQTGTTCTRQAHQSKEISHPPIYQRLDVRSRR